MGVKKTYKKTKNTNFNKRNKGSKYFIAIHTRTLYTFIILLRASGFDLDGRDSEHAGPAFSVRE